MRYSRELSEVIRGLIFSTKIGFFINLKSIFNFWSSQEHSAMVEINLESGSAPGEAA